MRALVLEIWEWSQGGGVQHQVWVTHCYKASCVRALVLENWE